MSNVNKIDKLRINRLTAFNKSVQELLDLHDSTDKIAVETAMDNMLRKTRLLTDLIDDAYSRVEIEQIAATLYDRFYNKYYL